jgi:hypothetical protein
MIKRGQLNALVEDYREKHLPCKIGELDSFRDESYDEAVRRAALARKRDGTKYGHQNRLENDRLRAARDLLAASLSYEEARRMNFDQLHDRLFDLLVSAGLWRRPDLYAYDTALRIGANTGIEPAQVYLHAGTREGAAHLGIGAKQDRIPPSVFPKQIRVLKPDQIEDFLCIYKDDLKALAVGGSLADLKGRNGCAYRRHHDRCC